MLGACAKGSFAMNASSKVERAVASAVAVNTAPLSIPVEERMEVFTARI